MQKTIKSALISVYHKTGLESVIKELISKDIAIYSTGGTQKFLEESGAKVIPVEDLTSYPSIFGGRVKTLHPKVFGGILYRRDLAQDKQEAENYEIPSIDLVIVDLYPFQETVANTDEEAEIIEKIDIGGISLIRAAAKNFKDVLIVSSQEQYSDLEAILKEQDASTSLEERKNFAARAFDISSEYDTAIFEYFNKDSKLDIFKQSVKPGRTLRYGENPHQKSTFYGNLENMFEQLHGKELSFNNLVDIDATVALVQEFDKTAFAIIKHTNACGIALGNSVKEAYLKALEADTVSAFGGILATNAEIDKDAAEEIHKLFCEVVIAPTFSDEALEILKGKKNRVLLKQKMKIDSKPQFKSLLNGVIEQDKDLKAETKDELKVVTEKEPSQEEINAMIFANKVAKHTKSNVIVLAKEGQMLASGVGQTSRVDAANQAVAKAARFGLDLNGAVMASDAFFPFPDCVEVAHEAGITAIIQPGGSIKDQDSIDACNANGIAMVFTGIRHFKH
jgi:phosphoribosylaminoimidazolecarboxamide formyltransferase/IMP cyclohydrolase